MNESNLEKYPAQKHSNSENRVTIKTEKAKYPAAVKAITVEIYNESDKEYMTGAHVFLVKKVDGIWRKVPMKAKGFTEQGMIHPPNEVSSLSLNVDDLNYELTPGEYQALIGALAAPFKIVE
ncbi:immunoglobulin-like domain-containing protein [Bacillus sp. PK3_68]|uniref:immunoglobulin-like domain-containing protein n=1 Tax=Bacillus sp. PK3_68 TaxID=2027408 RepID=UPI0031839C70